MLERLSKILRLHIESDVEITPESALLSDLGINSYEFTAIINEIEDEFDIEIPDKKLKSFVTVGDVISYIGHN